MTCSPKFATRRRPERDSFGGELASIAVKLGQPFMPWQRDAAEVGCEIDPETDRPAYRKVLVTVPRQQGKALDCDTELLTANRGWTTMADVQVGDQVFHPGGYPVTVTFVSEVMHGHDCYQVTTSDGRSVIADADHLWTVTDKRRQVALGPKWQRANYRFRVITRTTAQLAAAGLSRYRTGGRTSVTDGKRYATNEGRFVLPGQEPVKSPDVVLPIDPYLFGAWLGDGTSRTAALTSADEDVPHWVAEIERCGFIPAVHADHDRAARIGITSVRTRHACIRCGSPDRQARGLCSECYGHQRRRGLLHQWPVVGHGQLSLPAQLRALGCLGNKHVPDLYLTAGTAQREALLQGLLDTDGTIDRQRGQVSFCSTLLVLADAVLFLARSLGWRATMSIGRAKLYGRDCGPKYNVNFTPKTTDPFSPFRLPRKVARIREIDGNKGRTTVSIAAIEPVTSRPVRCIQVDSPDGLYLAGRDLIPTHNTTLFLSWQLNRCLSPRWAQPQRSAFTAQSGKDARDKWLDEIFPLIRRSRGVMPLVGRIYEGMGNEYVRFRNGSLIRLLSTSNSSGHSKTLHQAVLDEIWHDADGRREQGLGPAMLTVADAQLLLCSTAGTDASVILDRYMRLGRESVAADSGHGIAYIEYSAPDGWDPEDEASYFGFMPALCPDPPCRCGRGKWRHTVTMDAIRSERASMESAEFARAYGNIPDRSSGAGLWTVLPEQAWSALADPESHPVPRVVLSAVFAHDQSAASVGLAGWRPDGLLHAEVADYRPGTSWAVPRLVDMNARHEPLGVVVDEAGHESVIIKDLEAAGVPVIKIGTRGVTQAYAELIQDVTDSKTLRHRNQADLNDALAVAVTRDVGDGGQALGRRKSAGDISPVVSVMNAAWGLRIKTAEGGGDPGAWLI